MMIARALAHVAALFVLVSATCEDGAGTCHLPQDGSEEVVSTFLLQTRIVNEIQTEEQDDGEIAVLQHNRSKTATPAAREGDEDTSEIAPRPDPAPTQLRFQDLKSQFTLGLQELATLEKMNTESPVVVTVLNDEYKNYVVRWSQHLNQLGLHQQVIIALDTSTVELATGAGLSVLTHAGKLVTNKPRLSLLGGRTRWLVPENLGTLKFLVPCLLLQHFETVIFSEADVYMFGNPMIALPPHAYHPDESNPTEVSGLIAMMPETPDISNIGFMIFNGKSSTKLLEQFSQEWFDNHKDKEPPAGDQWAFNDMLSKDSGIGKADLPPPTFATRLAALGDSTIVAHFASSYPSCKHFFLEQLYNGSLPNAAALHQSYLSLPADVHRESARGYDCAM